MAKLGVRWIAPILLGAALAACGGGSTASDSGRGSTTAADTTTTSAAPDPSSNTSQPPDRDDEAPYIETFGQVQRWEDTNDLQSVELKASRILFAEDFPRSTLGSTGCEVDPQRDAVVRVQLALTNENTDLDQVVESGLRSWWSSAQVLNRVHGSFGEGCAYLTDPSNSMTCASTEAIAPGATVSCEGLVVIEDFVKPGLTDDEQISQRQAFVSSAGLRLDCCVIDSRTLTIESASGPWQAVDMDGFRFSHAFEFWEVAVG